ncbi:MAG: DUF4340 domain-containing protein [Verrucomicrobiota bacterium]
MNGKQLSILVVLVVLIGAAGLVVRQRAADSWRSGGQAIGQKLLPDLAVNDVAEISVTAGTNGLHLVRRDNLWRVKERQDYPASFSEISGLLLKFADLKAVQSQEVGPSQLGRFELLPAGPQANSGTLVEFKSEAGKVLGSLLLGKKHLSKASGGGMEGMGAGGWPDGRYVLTRDGKAAVLISDPLDNVQPKPEDWLAKDFLNVDRLRSIAVLYHEGTNSWKLTRASETNDWQLAEAGASEKLDESKTAGVTSPLVSASFTDVLPGNASTQISGMTNTTTLALETFDGFSYAIGIGEKAGDNYPVKLAVTAQLPAERKASAEEKPEDKTRLDKEFKDRQKTLTDKLAREKALEGWIYRLPSYTLDSTLKRRSELLVEAAKETAAAPVEK